MALDRKGIEAVLTESNIEFQWTPDGPLLPGGWCLRAGSGIAGHGKHWFAWHLPSNTKLPDTVKSKAALYRLLLKIEGGDLWRLKFEIKPGWLPVTPPKAKE